MPTAHLLTIAGSCRQRRAAGAVDDAHRRSCIAVGETYVPSGPLERVKNIALSAHIDAGKRRQRSRILFYTGAPTAWAVWTTGPQDRLDGAGTASVASPLWPPPITCFWRNCQIKLLIHRGTLILRQKWQRRPARLDGGVVVLDAVAGVEPQSEPVCTRQIRSRCHASASLTKWIALGRFLARRGHDSRATGGTALGHASANWQRVILQWGGGSD